MLALFALFTVVLIVLIFQVDAKRARDCRNKGGEYVRLYKSSVCVKPGTVLR